MNRSLPVVLVGLLMTGTSQRTVVAQTAAPAHHEVIGVGVNVTQALGAKPWSIVSVRASLPAGDTLGFDVDVGHVFGADDLTTGWRPRGFAFAAHLRWKPKGRSAGGTSGYLVLGPRVVQGRDEDKNGNRSTSTFKGADIGVGVDHVFGAGLRAGGELGNGSAGEAAMPFVSGFFLFGRP